MHDYDEPVYLISVVAKMFNIHPQTLRQYEREGFIEPSRTDGHIRLYSQRDIDKIRMILRLTRDLGVNLAGIDVIIRLKNRIDEMEKDIEELREKLNISASTKGFGVEKSKSVVSKKSSYDIIIFE